MKSKTLEDYLVTIYRLEEVMGIAKTTDIAEELLVKPATVTKTIKSLASRGFVDYNKYRGFKLSKAGREIAEKIIYKHRVAETFLNRVLGFDLFRCHELAHSMEHLPEEIINALDRYMGFPVKCPHNSFIPGKGSHIKEPRLFEGEEGRSYIITGILGELRSVMEKLRLYNVVPGTKVKIISRDKKQIVVDVNGSLVSFSKRDAISITVSDLV